LSPNSRIHLTRWAVTALAEKHRRQSHHLGLPGPRRPQPAGDANVRRMWTAHHVRGFVAALLCLVASELRTPVLAATTRPPVPIAFTTYYPVPTTPLEMSGTAEPFCAAIKSTAAWSELWSQLDQLSARMPQAPRIDFSRQTLLVISLGEHEGECPMAFVHSVLDFGDSLLVSACSLQSQVCPGMTFRPIAFALVPKTSVPVSFHVDLALRQGHRGCP
jgi:hypothetical protein